MFTFEFLAARHGDCILVHWGGNRLMLVDGGPHPVYEETLRPRLLALPHDPGQPLTLDVVCATHVDDDHIVGVVKLLTELRRTRLDQLPEPFRIKRLWHNSVEELVEIVAPGLPASLQPMLEEARADAVVGASYNQGRDVRDNAKVLGLAGNPPFGGAITTGGKAEIGGLVVTVVTPDHEAMQELADKWRAAKQRKDPAVIAQAFRDRAVPNLSSIAMHLQCGTRTALLTGDARGDHVLDGIQEVELLQPGGALRVDVLQLPHHGSENNVERTFFERIRADHYVVSADGVKHRHPSEDTLRWLVESRAADDEYTIHFTNEITFARENLAQLQRGRRFVVDMGPADRRSATVSLAA
jgi:beta-lactamase superfamily II metal-dependent hydrolase